MNTESQTFLQSIDEALEDADPFESALAVTLEHFHADSGTVHRMADGALELVAASARIPAVVLEKIQRIPIGKGMAGLAAERREPVNTCNLQTDTTGDVRPGAKATGLLGSICVPVFSGEQVVGTLGIGNHEEREFSQEEIELLLEAGRRIARKAAPDA